MVYARFLQPRWRVGALVAWTLLLAVVPHVGDAAPLPPLTADGSLDDPAAIRDRLHAQMIAARLRALGASPVDTAAILARLTREERAELAIRADEMAPGGNGFVLVAILVLLAAVLLHLPLAGRVEGWW